MFGPHPDDMGPMATMADAHREWHLNTGIPVGTPGCPQDACHPADDYYLGDEDEALMPEAPAEKPRWWTQPDDYTGPHFREYDEPPF